MFLLLTLFYHGIWLFIHQVHGFYHSTTPYTQTVNSLFNGDWCGPPWRLVHPAVKPKTSCFIRWFFTFWLLLIKSLLVTCYSLVAWSLNKCCGPSIVLYILVSVSLYLQLYCRLKLKRLKRGGKGYWKAQHKVEMVSFICITMILLLSYICLVCLFISLKIYIHFLGDGWGEGIHARETSSKKVLLLFLSDTISSCVIGTWLVMYFFWFRT